MKCWDVHILTVLWVYMNTRRKLTGHKPFRLVYGIEFVMHMEYIMPSHYIVSFTGMENHTDLVEQLPQLMEFKEDIFLVRFNQ